jgi:hypothetical protein
MPIPEADRKRQAEFAARARAELEKHFEAWTARDVAEWWDRWCNVGMATHDGLGRTLMAVAGVRPRGIELDFDPFSET